MGAKFCDECGTALPVGLMLCLNRGTPLVGFAVAGEAAPILSWSPLVKPPNNLPGALPESEVRDAY